MSNLLRRTRLSRLLSGWTFCNMDVRLFEHSVVHVHYYYDFYRSQVRSSTIVTQIGQLGALTSL